MSAMVSTAPEVADRLAQLPKLGVGLSFQGPLKRFVEEQSDAFDFLEVIPDSLWTDRGPEVEPRYQEHVDTRDFLARVAERKPLIAHSIGLSIGSVDHFNRAHIEQIASWWQRYGFPWHSDHLSFNRLDHPTGHTMDVGFTMPVPYDQEVLDLLVERVNEMQARVPVPFLLENNVYYFEIPEQDMDEATFLNRLTERTGCGLLLDLHNIHVNATNHGFDPRDLLSGLDLSRVVEIHIAGGMTLAGVYMDAHSGPCPPEVWQLLREVLPQTPNLRGVVFEVFAGYAKAMGFEAIGAQLAQARDIVHRHL